jgi:uncharacterized membrane protein YhaH (DUF805 family)
MTFKQAMLAPFKKWLTFSGRSSRKEYWAFYFLTVGLVLFTLGFAGFVVFIPATTVTTRRLHDTGRSGWMQLLVFVPIAGFYLLYLTCKAGDKGDNSYGSDPWAVAKPVGQLAASSATPA